MSIEIIKLMEKLLSALRRLRKKSKLIQADVAHVIDVKSNTFSKKERGDIPLTFEEVAKLFAFYRDHIENSEYYDAFFDAHETYFDKYDFFDKMYQESINTDEELEKLFSGKAGQIVSRREIQNLVYKLNRLDKAGYDKLNEWLKENLPDPLEEMVKEDYKKRKGREIDPDMLKKAVQILKSVDAPEKMWKAAADLMDVID